MRLAFDMRDLHGILAPPEATKGSKKQLFGCGLHLNSFKLLLILITELFGASFGWRLPCSAC